MPRAKVTQIGVKFPTEMADRIKAEAERRMVSPGYLIIAAMRLFLDEQAGGSSWTVESVPPSVERPDTP